MTAAQIHRKTDESQRHWLNIVQLFFFASAIILLSVMNFSHSSAETKRPAILLTASIFALLNFAKIKELSIISKIILLYIIEMFFNQLSGEVFHIQSFSISLPLIAMVLLAVSFIYYKFQKSHITSVDTNDLFKSWAVVFTVVICHMLILFLLLKQIYGYGYDHNFAVLANVCLYFLVFVFSWEQLEQINFRRIAAIIFAAFFIVIMIKGLQ